MVDRHSGVSILLGIHTRVRSKGVGIMSDPITHKNCGGEIVSEELEVIGYEIISDGIGGWDYAMKRAYSYGDDRGDSSPMFKCLKCDWSSEHQLSVLDGTVMTDKYEGKL